MSAPTGKPPTPALVGVRCSSLGPVEYCIAHAPLQVGELVLVGSAAERRTGQVVVAAEQVAYASIPSAERPLATPAVAPTARGSAEGPASSAGESAVGNELGALGALAARDARGSGTAPGQLDHRPPQGRLGLIGRLVAGLDGENRRYLARKLALPALGDHVALDGASGQVIAVDVRDERVVIRSAKGVVAERQGPGLQPAAPRETGGRASGRRGRGRRQAR